MARLAVPAGRTIADLVRAVFTIAVMLGVGVAGVCKKALAAEFGISRRSIYRLLAGCGGVL